MKSTDAHRIFSDWGRKGRVVFRTSDLRKLFSEDSDKAFRKGIDRLIKRGDLVRAANGVFVHARSDKISANLIEEIAVAIRRGSYCYLSLESALSEYGIISQIPLSGITVMTTGRAGVFETPYGRIEFTHTKRSPSDILENTRDVGRPLRLVGPAAARRDLLRVGRNTHLIDEEAYEEVMSVG